MQDPLSKKFHEPSAVPGEWDEAAPTLADGLTLREFILFLARIKRFLLRQWICLIFPGLLGGSIGVALAYVLPPAAVAVCEIRLVPTTAENPVSRFKRSNVEYFRSTEQNFLSQPLIKKTLMALGEKDIGDDRLSRVRSKLNFYSIAHKTYRGQFRADSDAQSMAFLKEHVKQYLDSEIKKTLKVIQAEESFLSQQLKQVEEELKKSESRLREFKEKHSDGLPAQAKEHYAIYRGLEQRRRDALASKQRMELELKLNKDKLSGQKLFVESKVISTQRAQPYQSAIVDINCQISRAKAGGMTEKHPELIRLRKLTGLLKALSLSTNKQSKTEIERTRNPIYESIQDSIYQLEISYDVASKKLDRINQDLVAMKEIVRKLPRLEALYAELTRDYNTNSQIYEQILKQLKVTQVQLDLERASVEARYDIFSPTHIEFTSFKKTLLIRGGALFALGMLMGLFIAIGREIRRYVQ